MQKFLLILIGLGLVGGTIQAQVFRRADSLRGALTPLRSCYDVSFYDLEVAFDIPNKRIAGQNVIHFTAVEAFDRLQIDLTPALDIEEIRFRGKKVAYRREARAVFLQFPEILPAGTRDSLRVRYSGPPPVAVNPPWQGGFVYETVYGQEPWVAVACEGLGASVWWPLKDHPSDEPDSQRISLIVPREISAISNGVLRSKTPVPGGRTRWEWFVHSPINSYNVTFYLGPYAHFSDTLFREDGSQLALDYYVLKRNRVKAQRHFGQVKPMLACFETHFGPYPFPEDGFKLVEAPYWGMEHQSAVAYGNNYQQNEFDFDFIIVHESGHEWFGNSLTADDHGELWIQESFTTYAEAVYLECMSTYETVERYLAGQRKNIRNQQPILGPREVNYQGWDDADMYYKGAWMLHSLRHSVRNDSLWFAALRDFAIEHRHTLLNTDSVIRYFSRKLGADYRFLFDQYLRHPEPPTLEYQLKRGRNKLVARYRWRADEPDFRMPAALRLDEERVYLNPTTEWQETTLRDVTAKEVEWDLGKHYYRIEVVRK